MLIYWKLAHLMNRPDHIQMLTGHRRLCLFPASHRVNEKALRVKADVHWIIDGRKVAFEIQATNYDPSVFDEKIAYYTRKGYLTVYLFVGDNFC